MSRMRLLASLVVAAGMAAVSAAGANLVNGVAAVVNETVITFEDVQNLARRDLELIARRARTQAEFDKEALNLQKEVLETLIERNLIVSDFYAAGGKIPESFVDELVNERIRRQFVDRVTLTQMLRQSGRTYANYRKEQGEEAVREFMVRKNIAQEIMVSPRKMERYYEANREKFKVEDRVHIRMIVVGAGKSPRGEGARVPREVAREALARIRAGADFATVAKEVSDDARQFKGGDRGWITKSGTELRKDLQTVAFSLEAGAVSDVIETDAGAWIIKVEEKETAHLRTLVEARAEIETLLKQQEFERLRKAWVARLQRKSFVQRF